MLGHVVLQELLALPAITPAILQKFEADVAATGSEKEQRFIIRKLLMQSGMHSLSTQQLLVTCGLYDYPAVNMGLWKRK